jgi:hypothetical protein
VGPISTNRPLDGIPRLRLTGIWARFLASGAEQKLGGKAEAMPHDPVCDSTLVNALVGQTIGLCRLPFFGDPSNRVSPCGANGQAAKLGIFPRISVLSA